MSMVTHGMMIEGLGWYNGHQGQNFGLGDRLGGIQKNN